MAEETTHNDATQQAANTSGDTADLTKTSDTADLTKTSDTADPTKTSDTADLTKTSDTAEATKKTEDTSNDAANKPSDKEAELLKDVMKHKAKSRELQSKIDELTSSFEGVDVEEYKRLKAEKAEQDRKEAEARGDYEAIKNQMVEQHQAELTRRDEVQQEMQSQIETLKSRIEELTVGSNFDQSKFIAEETVLTPRKARVLYGAHFDFDGEKVVAYDKPRGEEGRAPLVGKDGEPVSFEEAFRRIVDADPDRDALLRAKMKPGADSSASKTETPKTESRPMTSQEKIAAGVGDLLKDVDFSKPTRNDGPAL